MLKVRIIPLLLLEEFKLVKTVQFQNARYVGDPINTVKIFNEKEVDELILLDIITTITGKRPNLKLISEIASECFMPICYGGGISSLEDIKTILGIGVEKVSINTKAIESPYFIKEAAGEFGSQSIVVSLDVKKTPLGKYEVYTHGGRKRILRNPVELACEIEQLGAGEILLNSIDRDGTMSGYEIELITQISQAVTIPVIAAGGAGKFSDFSDAIKKGGASAVAAGSFFVFHGKHRAVLISYPFSGLDKIPN